MNLTDEELGKIIRKHAQKIDKQFIEDNVEERIKKKIQEKLRKNEKIVKKKQKF